MSTEVHESNVRLTELAFHPITECPQRCNRSRNECHGIWIDAEVRD
jgi:hypothetical protein